ncbi:putative polypeptide N-acetylgalactosaminyltransferase 9 [Procambarus clarkii]
MVFLKTLLIRRRGVLLKLVVALPALWLLISLVTLSEKADKNDVMDLPPAVRIRDNQAPPDNRIIKVDSIKDLPERADRPQPPPEVPRVPKPHKPEVKSMTKTDEPHEIHAEQGVLLPPQEPNGPGEMGKPVTLPKDLDPETKKKVDEGWKNNAFNQYVSDMISVHRSLPDPRDEW